MAYVLFNNGRKELHTKPSDIKRLILVWRVKAGLVPSYDPLLTAYCKRVRRVRLNWHEAPDDYIRWHLNEIIERAVSEWCVDEHGKPLRPASSTAWAFAKKYGLWKSGKPTNLVTGWQTTLI